MPTLTYTVLEVAQELRVGRTTVYRLIASRRLPSILIGGSRRITQQALEHFIATCEANEGNL